MTYQQQIINLKNQGKSYNEIAMILGCSKGTVSYHLGNGQKEKTAQRQKNKRKMIKEYIQNLKGNTPCDCCKEYYPYWMMEFDHRPSETKLFGINKWYHFTNDFEVVKKEIDKCDILCSNCHRDRTYRRQVGK